MTTCPSITWGCGRNIAINDASAVNLWITNGTNQTEAFNNYRSQLLGLVITPTPQISWTTNFYNGQEHPDVIYLQSPGPGQTGLPNQQGTYILPIANPPTGKLDIVDSYVSWQATKALTFAAEADYVRERLYTYSSAGARGGGALYGGYQLTPKIAVAVRAEYLADVGGLYYGHHSISQGRHIHARLPPGRRFLDAQRIPPRSVEPPLFPERHVGRTRVLAADHRTGAHMVVRAKARRLVGGPAALPPLGGEESGEPLPLVSAYE